MIFDGFFIMKKISRLRERSSPMADKRKIGKSGLTVNPVGLGCMGFSHAYGAPTEKNEAMRKSVD